MAGRRMVTASCLDLDHLQDWTWALTVYRCMSVVFRLQTDQADARNSETRLPRAMFPLTSPSAAICEVP